MIRRYTLGDELGIAELEAECFSLPWSANAVVESKAHGTDFFVFEEDGKISGYVGIQTVLDEGYITNVAVTEKKRGRGIATALINEVRSFAKENGLSFVSLEVRASNSVAIELYLKCGFEKVGIRKNFYSAPTEDAVIMTIKEF